MSDSSESSTTVPATDSTSAITAQQPEANHRWYWWLAGIPLVVGYLLDLITKQIVVNTMEIGERIDVLPPILSWYFIRNPGAAFSIGTEYTWVFTIIQAVALVIVVVLIFRARSKIWLFVLGALAGGIAGNLTDRLFREPGFGRGHVVDFISVPNFAIFNIADSLIVCSMVAVVILVFMGIRLDGTRDTDAEADTDATEDTQNTEATS